MSKILTAEGLILNWLNPGVCGDGGRKMDRFGWYCCYCCCTSEEMPALIWATEHCSSLPQVPLPRWLVTREIRYSRLCPNQELKHRASGVGNDDEAQDFDDKPFLRAGSGWQVDRDFPSFAGFLRRPGKQNSQSVLTVWGTVLLLDPLLYVRFR